MATLKTQHLFILPGLRNHTFVIKFITRNWKQKFGIIVHIVTIDWHDKTTNFQQKMTSIISIVKPFIQNRNNIVSLLGISAGASAAVNVLEKLKQDDLNLNGGIILVCGRLRVGNLTGQKTLNRASRNSTAFKKSVIESEKIIDNLSSNEKLKLLTFYSLFDELVPSTVSQINGVKNIRLFTPGHIFSIGVVLVIYARKIINHLKIFDLLHFK